MRILFFLLILIPFIAKSQVYEGDVVYPANNLIYAELFGPTGLYSLNYERRLVLLPTASIYTRLGGSYVPATSALGIVPGLSFITGHGLTHFELGMGGSYIKLLDGNEVDRLIHANIGFRVQPLEGGFTMRINLYPMFSFTDARFIPYGGISAGYAF